MQQDQSLDALIEGKAVEFADQVVAAAKFSKTEEDVRIEVAHQIKVVAKEAKVELDSQHEMTIAKGRADSVYSRVIVEYKNPNDAGARIGPGKDAPGNAKVVKQIKDRFKGLEKEAGQPLNSLFGVGLDGLHFIFVTYRDNDWRVEDPVEVNRHSASRFLWAIFNLGRRGKPLKPEYLAGDFGSETTLAQHTVKALYDSICATDNPKANVFFDQWKILFSEVCGYEVDDPSDKVKELADAYLISPKGVRPAELFFALQTYYAIFMKMLAAEVVSFFQQLPSAKEKMINATTSAKLRRELRDLEDGGIFAKIGITNFLEGDLYAWYVEVWNDEIESCIRRIVTKLDDYNPGTLAEDPTETRDLLKKLYHELFPRQVRHDLGEYYTPDWLAEHVLNELGYVGDPDKRILDPACGSGTFLVMAINRIRQYFLDHRETMGIEENVLFQKIIKNVIGFDLNPLAVLAARTNYLISVRDLISRGGNIEIPIYLCDSILTPSEYGGLFNDGEGNWRSLKTAVGEFTIPTEIAADRQRIGEYALCLEHAVKMDLTSDAFIEDCRSEGLPVSQEKLHVNLYNKLSELNHEGRNGVWARIIKNAFAPLFIDRVDYIAGNPPWVNWEHLPKSYRQDTEHIWRDHMLIGNIPIAVRQKSDASSTDIAILMTYVAANVYLKSEGLLGFVITKSVFSSELGGWHFRRFKIPAINTSTKQPKFLKVLKVDDVTSLAPFKGRASNVPAVIYLETDKANDFPVPWHYYFSKSSTTPSEDDTYAEVADSLGRIEMEAIPVDKKYNQSPWLVCRKQIGSILNRISGESHYFDLCRNGFHTRGANGVFFLDCWEQDSRLFIRNIVDAGRDKELRSFTTSIEDEYIYPLLRGRDVGRYVALPSSAVLSAQNPEKATALVGFEQLPKNTRLFLHEFKDKLKSRKKFRNFDPTGQYWYGIYSMLSATYSDFKVVWREMTNGLIAAAVEPAMLPNGKCKTVLPDHKLYIIPCSSREESLFVAALINCSISTLLVASYATSTAVSTHILHRLPIPKFDPSSELHLSIADQSGHAHRHSRENDLRELKSADTQIDLLAAKLWGITDDELKAIQDTLAVMQKPKRRRKAKA